MISVAWPWLAFVYFIFTDETTQLLSVIGHFLPLLPVTVAQVCGSTVRCSGVVYVEIILPGTVVTVLAGRLELAIYFLFHLCTLSTAFCIFTELTDS